MEDHALNRVTILGTGGMGTALAVLLHASVRGLAIWGRDPEFVSRLERTRVNDRHLPGVLVPENVEFHADSERALRDADLIVAAIPSSFLRGSFKRLAANAASGVPVLSVIKGIENETFALPSEIIRQELGERPIAVLSGPSHAEEIARGLPASLVVAGSSAELNSAVRDLLNRGMFRVYTNPDALGVELAGALKNVLGIAAGICDGLGFGDNAKAALLTRGLAEIQRFGVELGASAATFAGLAGVGDLVTTCYSPFGRNRALGHKLGQGMSLSEALAATSSVAEGVATTKSVHDQATRRSIEMPITAELYQILFERKSPRAALHDLMLRPPKVEGQ